jgi:hypothetical protein
MNMESHYTLTDSEFEKQFTESKLEAKLFTHEAHIRLAWIHLYKYGEERAIQNINDQLYKFVSSLGESEKYNTTLTIAAVKIVKHYMDKKLFDNFKEYIEQYPNLKSNFRSLLEEHYSVYIFSSQEAKRNYIKPDINEFD